MKSITIKGSQRESVGKKATKALRNAGQVPCVLYGGDNPVHFTAEELAFSKLVYTPNALTVVAVVSNNPTVPLLVLIPVTNVGLVLNTTAPVPVSSLITPASCADVVAAN